MSYATVYAPDDKLSLFNPEINKYDKDLMSTTMINDATKILEIIQSCRRLSNDDDMIIISNFVGRASGSICSLPNNANPSSRFSTGKPRCFVLGENSPHLEKLVNDNSVIIIKGDPNMMMKIDMSEKAVKCGSKQVSYLTLYRVALEIDLAIGIKIHNGVEYVDIVP